MDRAEGDVGGGTGGQRVGDWMRRHFVSIPSGVSYREVETLMRTARLRHVPVVGGQRLEGLLSHRDLLLDGVAHLERELPADRVLELGDRSIAPLIRSEPEWVEPRTRLADAAARMAAYGVGCLPVIETTPDGCRIVGLLTESDLIAAAFGTRETRGASVQRPWRRSP